LPKSRENRLKPLGYTALRHYQRRRPREFLTLFFRVSSLFIAAWRQTNSLHLRNAARPIFSCDGVSGISQLANLRRGFAEQATFSSNAFRRRRIFAAKNASNPAVSKC
jgi:hypothetical protein